MLIREINIFLSKFRNMKIILILSFSFAWIYKVFSVIQNIGKLMVQIKVDKSCPKLIFIIYLLTLSVTDLDQGAEEGSLGTCQTVL